MINNRFNVVYHLLGLVKLLFYKLKIINMVSFTNEEQTKLYELGLSLDFNMDFQSDEIDLSCYKSNV
jgi:hypothetical protein